MLIIVHTKKETITFMSFDEVVEKLKCAKISDADKEEIARRACDLLNTSNMDHDKIEYYKNVFGYYLHPVVY